MPLRQIRLTTWESDPGTWAPARVLDPSKVNRRFDPFSLTPFLPRAMERRWFSPQKPGTAPMWGQPRFCWFLPLNERHSGGGLYWFPDGLCRQTEGRSCLRPCGLVLHVCDLVRLPLTVFSPSQAEQAGAEQQQGRGFGHRRGSAAFGVQLGILQVEVPAQGGDGDVQFPQQIQ